MDDQVAEHVGEAADSGKAAPEAPRKPLAALGLSALGIVFGDIGTSPLYTLKTVLSDAGGHPDRGVLLGVFSLLVWTLIIVTTLKYILVAMRIDNDGEGGILALMSLIGMKREARPLIVAAGLFGAALIYGDGAITPAISVLSALEGLHLAVPSFSPYVLPAAVVILALLFVLQPFGTATIGKLFGPVMAVWFVVIAVLGLVGIAQHPQVLAGLDPRYAIEYLAHGGFTGFALLGSIFLCVTGAEALYADMGHFGRGPIWLGWFAAVFPALILNYAGQTAIALAGAKTDDNIFFQLCPQLLLVPLVLLATAATIIASQSIITGAFSMTRQAIQLGWMPRLVIRQTSDEGYGQIYVAPVNWLLMVVTIGLALAFKKSDNLSAAYGMAVSATMLLTTGLLYLAMREVWRWPAVLAGAVAGFFLVVDLAFFGSNLLKVPDGGWVPLTLAVLVYGTMRVWHSGVAAIRARLGATTQPLDTFFDRLAQDGITRPEGTAIFLSRARDATPAADDLACPAEPLPLRRRADRHHRHGADAARRRCQPLRDHQGARQGLARADPLRLHGAPRPRRPAAGAEVPGLRHRHVEGGLLRRPRDHRPRSGREARPRHLGRDDLRRDGAQPGAPDRRARPAERPGGRDRPAYRAVGHGSSPVRGRSPLARPGLRRLVTAIRPVDPSRPLKSAIGGTSWTGGMRRH